MCVGARGRPHARPCTGGDGAGEDIKAQGREHAPRLLQPPRSVPWPTAGPPSGGRQHWHSPFLSRAAVLGVARIGLAELCSRVCAHMAVRVLCACAPVTLLLCPRGVGSSVCRDSWPIVPTMKCLCLRKSWCFRVSAYSSWPFCCCARVGRQRTLWAARWICERGGCMWRGWLAWGGGLGGPRICRRAVCVELGTKGPPAHACTRTHIHL